MARPTKLTPALIKNARDFVTKRQGDKILLPTVEGLALELRISRETVYAWCDPLPESTKPADLSPAGDAVWDIENRERHQLHQEFSDIVSDLKSAQAEKLMQLSLSGRYNATIAKLILSGKHGYVEKSAQDITSDGKAVGPVLVKFVGEDQEG